MHGPERARELGFVDEVVEPPRLRARCVELAQRLASVAQPAYAYVKQELQRDALARTLNFPQERSKALAAVGATEESREMLRKQVGSISRG